MEEFFNVEILLNSPEDTFLTTDPIVGVVTLINPPTIGIQFIQIQLQGKITTSLVDANEMAVQDSEDIIKLEQILLQMDGQRGLDNPTKLPFEFEPLLNLPASFYSYFGAIEYKVLVIANPMGDVQDDLILQERLLNIKLNFHPLPNPVEEYQVPINYTMDRDINTNLHFRFKVPQSSFQFGQELPFLLEIFDKEEDVGAKVSLFQRIVYRVGTVVFRDYSEITSKVNELIDKSNIWDENLLIPAEGIPIHFGFPNDLIDLQYYLQVELLSCEDTVGDGRRVLLTSGQIGLIIGASFCLDDEEMNFCPPGIERVPQGSTEGLPLRSSRSRNVSNQSVQSLPTYSMLSINNTENLPSYSEAITKEQ